MDNRGIEPRPDACKTPVLPLTPVAQRDQPGSRTLLRRFAGDASTLEADQSWSSENRTLRVAMTQGLQPRLCPSTRPAEEGGVEPLACRLASLSRGGAPHGAHLPEEGRGIEPLAED